MTILITLDPDTRTKTTRFHCHKCGIPVTIETGARERVVSNLCLECEERAVRRELKLK